MDRVFLDANILFSAAYKPGSRLLALWEHRGLLLLTSAYAAEEARRNLSLVRAAQLPELERLLADVAVVLEAPPELEALGSVPLVEKDRPILAAAVAVGATHLLTGDKRHFGALYGQRVGGVLVVDPSHYLNSPPG